MSGKLGEEAINALLTYFRSKGKMVKEAHIELTTVFGPECGVTQAYCERFYSDTNKAAVEEANKMDKVKVEMIDLTENTAHGNENDIPKPKTTQASLLGWLNTEPETSGSSRKRGRNSVATSSPAVTPTITTKLLPQPKKDVAAKKAKKTKLTTEEEENSEKVGETSSAGVGGKDRTFAYKPRRWGERRKPEHETAAQAFKNRPEIAHLCLDYHPTTDHLRAVISRRRMTENLISLRIGVDDQNYKSVWPVLDACPRLEYLALQFSGGHAGDRAMNAVGRLKKFPVALPATLKHLWLYYGDDNTLPQPCFYNILARAPATLESLTIDCNDSMGFGRRDYGFDPVKHFFKSLKCLCLSPAHKDDLEFLLAEANPAKLCALELDFDVGTELSDKIIAKFPLLEYVRVGAFTLPQFAKLEHLRVMHMPIVDYSKMKAKAAVESAKEEDKEALNQIIARGRLEWIEASGNLSMAQLCELIRSCPKLMYMNCHRLEKFEESEADALKKALGERCERRKELGLSIPAINLTDFEAKNWHRWSGDKNDPGYVRVSEVPPGALLLFILERTYFTAKKGELPPPDQAPTEALRSELANSFGAVMMKGRSSIRGRNRVLQQLNTAGMIEPPGRAFLDGDEV